MFSSAAHEENNYSVSAEWMLDLPPINAQFGHDSHQSFCSTATVISNGGTDHLHRFLMSIVDGLYPDAQDEVGC
jgi:hypothetical protein